MKFFSPLIQLTRTVSFTKVANYLIFTGIYDIEINTQQQKLTVVGWADPERIIKAIKKTRKLATICAHTEASEPQQPTTPPPPPPEGNPPAPDAGNPPPTETPPAESAPPAEAPEEQPPPAQPSENPPQEATPPSPAPTANAAPTQTAGAGPSEPKDVEEIHIIHHHPHQYGYSDPWNSYTNGYGFRPDGPHYTTTTHNYNHFRPSPYISAYDMEYGHSRSQPQILQYQYSRAEQYGDDHYYHNGGVNGNGNNITSVFSDENPNACRIV